ncbi:MAG: hypothetical protein JNM75_08190 [Rhodospirillales bacterium]|nr:hypothetical protein [Rhodospirillales bacterium]
MTSSKTRLGRTLQGLAGVSLVLGVAGAISLSPMLASPARAQDGAAIGGVGESQASSMQATVKSIDAAARRATLVGPDGDELNVKLSKEVRNLDQVRPGDKVVVRYYDSTVYVIAPAGQRAPDDMSAVATARAQPGALPGAAVAQKIILSGLVVGVDPSAHTISLVDQSGGKVHTLNVQDEEARKMLGMVNVGDSITAYLTDAVAIAVEPVSK